MMDSNTRSISTAKSKWKILFLSVLLSIQSSVQIKGELFTFLCPLMDVKDSPYEHLFFTLSQYDIVQC